MSKRKNGTRYAIKCHNCGEEFVATRVDAKVCGNACRQERWRAIRRPRLPKGVRRLPRAFEEGL